MLDLSVRIQPPSQSILEYTEIQLNLSTTATLGTEERRHCSEVAAVEKFKQESMYVLCAKKVAVVER